MDYVLHQTDRICCTLAEHGLEKTRPTQIVDVERIGAGRLVEFADGGRALYSSDLLHAILPQTVEIETSEPEPKRSH